jgi:hypothetical protein
MKFLLLLSVVACVKGNPFQGSASQHGGTLAVPGCGYSITTVDGAEAPELANAAIIATDPTVRLVHLGVVGNPQTSVVVQWRTVDEQTRAGEVHYAVGAQLTADQLTQIAGGLDFGYRGLQNMTEPTYRQHQAHLCGLTAGTTYSYQIVSGGKTSPVYTFHTAPDITATPDAHVVFGFVGDSRGGYDVFTQLVQVIQSRAPDVILYSGDAVTIGITQEEWETFLGAGEPLFATTQVLFANGNHENDAVNFFSQFALPGDQQNFGLDWGDAHVTVANDTPADPSAITGAFRDALNADLAASQNAQWKLVMHHQPMFSASTRHGSSTTLQAAWGPLFDQYHVDLVLNGHDHDYELTRPLVGGIPQATSANATVYVVAGGAGAELYPNGTQAFTQCSESNYSAAIIDVRKHMLSLDAFHPDGTAISNMSMNPSLGCNFMKTK